jgi:hypothetical protein
MNQAMMWRTLHNQDFAAIHAITRKTSTANLHADLQGGDLTRYGQPDNARRCIEAELQLRQLIAARLPTRRLSNNGGTLFYSETRWYVLDPRDNATRGERYVAPEERI